MSRNVPISLATTTRPLTYLIFSPSLYARNGKLAAYSSLSEVFLMLDPVYSSSPPNQPSPESVHQQCSYDTNAKSVPQTDNSEWKKSSVSVIAAHFSSIYVHDFSKQTYEWICTLQSRHINTCDIPLTIGLRFLPVIAFSMTSCKSLNESCTCRNSYLHVSKFSKTAYFLFIGDQSEENC